MSSINPQENTTSPPHKTTTVVDTFSDIAPDTSQPTTATSGAAQPTIATPASQSNQGTQSKSVFSIYCSLVFEKVMANAFIWLVAYFVLDKVFLQLVIPGKFDPINWKNLADFSVMSIFGASAILTGLVAYFSILRTTKHTKKFFVKVQEEIATASINMGSITMVGAIAESNTTLRFIIFSLVFYFAGLRLYAEGYLDKE